jgi:hypothetical protein
MNKTNGAETVLKPVLIIGSGFHCHVFASGGASPSSKRSSLYHWEALIDAVADNMQVARPDRSLKPVLRWEALLDIGAKDGYATSGGLWRSPGSLATYRIEIEARRHVASVLSKAAEDYPGSRRARIPAQSKWASVISLNFDPAWYPRKPDLEHAKNIDGRKDVLSPEIPRLFRSIAPVDGVPRVWFPNGSIMECRTIRMGLRDYGTASAGILMAFRQLKKWERRRFSGVDLRSREGFEELARVLVQAEAQDAIGEGPPKSWVTDFIYRPLVFAGVGLSAQEAGLWWLLRQKARNVARVSGGTAAQVRVLTNESRPEFSEAGPFGITPVRCSNWDEGWERIIGE